MLFVSENIDMNREMLIEYRSEEHVEQTTSQPEWLR